jgi:hypothetical protein
MYFLTFYILYSVGILLWEIFELKKPYSDFNKSELLASLSKGFCLPFSEYVPDEWKEIVSRGIYYSKIKIYFVLNINSNFFFYFS